MKKISHSEEQTKKIAEEFVSRLKGGDIVGLVGDLGSGKTVFVRGVVEALHGKTKVKSPTFTIMNEYPVSGEGISRVLHLDLYRFEKSQHLEALALEDEMREDTIIFIEWPDAVETQFNQTHEVHFVFVDENTREINFDYGK